MQFACPYRIKHLATSRDNLLYVKKCGWMILQLPKLQTQSVLEGVKQRAFKFPQRQSALGFWLPGFLGQQSTEQVCQWSRV